jgi:hypothetical protein
LHEEQLKKRGQGGDDLDDTEPGSLAHAGGNDDSAEEDVDGYYSLVQRQKREQKESKKVAYEAAKATIRCVIQPALYFTSPSPPNLCMHIQRDR